MPPAKHLFTAVVCLAWLVMAGMLVRRQAAPEATPLASLPLAPRVDAVAGETEEWFGVYKGTQKIGHTVRLTAPIEGGRRLTDRSTMSFAMLGTAQTVRMALVAETDERSVLRRFQFTLTSPAATLAATGETDGTRIRVEYSVGGRRERVDLPLAQPIELLGGLRPRIAAAWPAPGTRFTHTVLNPMTMRGEPVVTVVEGEERLDGVDALRLTESQGGLEVRAWLDRAGRVLREESVLGLVLVREPREVALAGRPGDDPVDVTAMARIPVDAPIADPRRRTALSLRVAGPGAVLVPDDPPRQRRSGSLLRVAREAVPRAAAVTPDAALAPYLAPAPFIESDDPEIVAAARAAVGDETDPVRRAHRLVRWVSRNLEQTPSVTMPSARQVLRARRGDCNEHAVLLAAMARAAGLPARVVVGAVYVDDGFYYHAWTEIWLGAWVSADAVFAQLPADATHVKLMEGGPERHFQLAGVLDRLRFQVVEEDT
ncbi:MAG TPA: transglutaminase-like domain-containing protein [Candidatus Limnocylindria bacterium]|nr:transglutaminase-like domain-containing protein [Candidatus Limnocylindria bacterium]